MRMLMHYAVITYAILLLLNVVDASTPTTKKCSRGRYLLAGKTDCIMCPRGRYGSTTGLTSSLCTDACPPGRYQDILGASSLDDCKPCPPNTWSGGLGLINREDCTRCDPGTFNLLWGASSAGACQTCSPGYLNGECVAGVTLYTEGSINYT